MKSTVIGVGGFLGLGEKNVAIDFPKLSWMEANGDRWLLTDASKSGCAQHSAQGGRQGAAYYCFTTQQSRGGSGVVEPQGWSNVNALPLVGDRPSSPNG